MVEEWTTKYMTTEGYSRGKTPTHSSVESTIFDMLKSLEVHKRETEQK